MNHSDRFYAKVLRVFLDYWAQHKWLKENGELLMARFVYSARATTSTETKLDRIKAAKDWCEKHKAEGDLAYSSENSKGRFVRFTTPFLNSLIPESEDNLSPWGTKNYYFYEITNFKGEFYVQLYFYCKNLSPEMQDAISHLAAIMNLGNLTNGYKLFFKSSAYPNEDSDTAETVCSQLDSIFNEVKTFEAKVGLKWRD